MKESVSENWTFGSRKAMGKRWKDLVKKMQRSKNQATKRGPVQNISLLSKKKKDDWQCNNEFPKPRQKKTVPHSIVTPQGNQTNAVKNNGNETGAGCAWGKRAEQSWIRERN